MYAMREYVSVEDSLKNTKCQKAMYGMRQPSLTCNDGTGGDGTTENLPMASKKSAVSVPSNWREVFGQPILLDS